jgi:hypothetical protein
MTALQPAIALLESLRDFPKDSPILIITDGMWEPQLTVTRSRVPAGRPGADCHS